jgi:hypothetical protein
MWPDFNDSPKATAPTAMQPITGHTPTAESQTDIEADIEADFWRELADIEAESIGWLPLGEGCYLHTGNDSAEILIVGSASASLAGLNMLWVC